MSHKKVVRIDPLTRALPMGGVDSHAHIDDKAFDQDREAVLARAHDVGLAQVINIFLDPLVFAERVHIFDAHPETFFVLGVHPCDGLKWSGAQAQAMREAFAIEPRLRAVGEIGLDFHWPDCPREVQLAVFGEQLALARELGCPVVIHCREAEAECLTMLEARGFAGYPLLWHCFGGDTSLARRLARNGWHVSVPGSVTFKSNRAVREALAVIPRERLLFETDCPYLAPEPWRGARNEPAYTVFTVRAMAEILDVEAAELWQACGDNARRFFGINGHGAYA